MWSTTPANLQGVQARQMKALFFPSEIPKLSTSNRPTAQCHHDDHIKLNHIWRFFSVMERLFTGLHPSAAVENIVQRGVDSLSALAEKKHSWTQFLHSVIHARVLANFINIKSIGREHPAHFITAWRGTARVTMCVCVCVCPGLLQRQPLGQDQCCDPVPSLSTGCRLAAFCSGNEPLIWSRCEREREREGLRKAGINTRSKQHDFLFHRFQMSIQNKTRVFKRS